MNSKWNSTLFWAIHHSLLVSIEARHLLRGNPWQWIQYHQVWSLLRELNVSTRITCCLKISCSLSTIRFFVSGKSISVFLCLLFACLCPIWFCKAFELGHLIQISLRSYTWGLRMSRISWKRHLFFCEHSWCRNQLGPRSSTVFSRLDGWLEQEQIFHLFSQGGSIYPSSIKLRDYSVFLIDSKRLIFFH